MSTTPDSTSSDSASKPTPNIQPADGKLGILIPGMGAVTTTFIAGVEAIKRAWRSRSAPSPSSTPSVSASAPTTTRRRSKISCRSPKIEDLEFGGWDIFDENCYEAALHAGVLDKPLVESCASPLEKIKPMPAVFDSEYVKRINGPNLKPKGSKMDHAEMLMDDIRKFKERTGSATGWR